jgi:uncharacterized protein YgbK (DUF1537 family)
MIAAIADDLTGAAEIAGIGWRYGLRAEILQHDQAVSRSDLVVFDSDSRNCSAADGRLRVMTILNRFAKARPAWLYKKIDSVLRGNVAAEAEAALAALHLSRCLIVSANPSSDRVVRDGRYFIRGVPLDRTDFRHDPKHPRTSARVLDLVGRSKQWATRVQRAPASSAPDGITVGEAAKPEDVARWAAAVDETILPIGGGDFFTALLEAHGLRADPGRLQSTFPTGGSTLFVSGSPADASLSFIEQARSRGWPVSLMPDEMLRPTKNPAKSKSGWAKQIAEALRHYPRVVMGVGRPPLPGRTTPARLGRLLTESVAEVLGLARPATVCAEGGATTASLIDRLGWKRLIVEREWQRGVTALRPSRPGSLSLVCKPGSYEWPRQLLA